MNQIVSCGILPIPEIMTERTAQQYLAYCSNLSQAGLGSSNYRFFESYLTQTNTTESNEATQVMRIALATVKLDKVFNIPSSVTKLYTVSFAYLPSEFRA